MFNLITGAVTHGSGDAGVIAFVMAFMFLFLFLFIVPLYIYYSITLMTIAKRTKTEDAWLAWVPIVNIYLMARVAKVPMWSLAFFALIFLPTVGSLAVSGMMVWYWWMISERLDRPGWWGLLMLVPVVNLVLRGFLAWGNVSKPKKNSGSKKKQVPKKPKVSKKTKKSKK